MNTITTLINTLVKIKTMIKSALYISGTVICKGVYHTLTIVAGKDKITETAVTHALKGISKSAGRAAICVVVLGLFALSAYNESLGNGRLVVSAYDIPKQIVYNSHQEKEQKRKLEGQRAVYRYNQAVRSSYSDRELREIQTFGPIRGSRY